MTGASATWTALRRDGARLSGRTGEGVPVAVLDSGVNPENPHVRSVAGTAAIGTDGREDGDPLDRLGHGTAVAAVVQEKAPSAELLALKIFHRTLSTDAGTLAAAIDRAIDRGARLVNLSLGTAEPGSRPTLEAAVERAVDRGALVVSAREHRGRRWWPGSLPGVAGVLLDWECPRHELRMGQGPAGEPVFRASGFPRPVPGLPRSRNLKGISFAVANVTGLLALLLEAEPEIATIEEVAEWMTTV